MSWLNLQWIHPENEKAPWILFVLFCFMGMVNFILIFSSPFMSTGIIVEIAGVTVLYSEICLFIFSGLALIQIKWFALINFIIILPIVFWHISIFIYIFSRPLRIIDLIIFFGYFGIPAILTCYIFSLSFSILKDKRYSFKEKFSYSNRWKRIIFATIPFILFILYLLPIDINF